MYRVKQSKSNSFWGDVVFDSVNMAYSDEDSIIDQIYSSKYFRTFIKRFKILRVIEENAYNMIYSTQQQGTH